MTTKKLKYKGSANRIPKYNLKFNNGDVIEVSDQIARKLLNKNIGFTEVKNKKSKPKKKGD